jgi:hypothetical protein
MNSTKTELSRKRAFLAVLPFLLLGLADVILLLLWGLDPLWGFMILPPILFISTIGWIAFRSGFTQQDASESGITHHEASESGESRESGESA